MVYNNESAYQRRLMGRIGDMFPGCIMLKNDPDEYQGIPDLLILFGPHWAMLEVKLHKDSRQRPNQEFHIRVLNDMSFAAFIYPENEDKVLDELQSAFRSFG